MSRSDLGTIFLGVMAVLCVGALGLGILRYRQFDANIAQLERQNEILKKSEKVAKADTDLRALVAKSSMYVDAGDFAGDPVEFITQSSKKRGVDLDAISPRTSTRAGRGVEETVIEITEKDVAIPPIAELLFYLEEAFPGGLVVKEMTLTRNKGEDDLWDSRITLSHIVLKQE